jgi:hypothetical protein
MQERKREGREKEASKTLFLLTLTVQNFYSPPLSVSGWRRWLVAMRTTHPITGSTVVPSCSERCYLDPLRRQLTRCDRQQNAKEEWQTAKSNTRVLMMIETIEEVQHHRTRDSWLKAAYNNSMEIPYVIGGYTNSARSGCQDLINYAHANHVIVASLPLYIVPVV